MGPGPWVVELSELVVTSCDVVVTGSVAVAVVVLPASVVATVVSSLIVVVCIVVSVTGADVELVDGGLVLPGIGRSPQFT